MDYNVKIIVEFGEETQTIEYIGNAETIEEAVESIKNDLDII